MVRGPRFALDDSLLDDGDLLGGGPRLAVAVLASLQDVLVAAPGRALGDGQRVRVVSPLPQFVAALVFLARERVLS